MIYKGGVRGKTVELEHNVLLPEGTEVQVVVGRIPGEGSAGGDVAEGSPQAVLAALQVAPRCSIADVDALLDAIEQGKRPVRFEGDFDHRGSRR